MLNKDTVVFTKARRFREVLDMSEYEDAFKKALKGPANELEIMIEKTKAKYESLGMDFEEESGIQEFVTKLYNTGDEVTIRIYELVKKILDAGPNDFKSFEEFTASIREQSEGLSVGEAVLLGSILSAQMRLQIRIRRKHMEEQEPRSANVSSEPLCTRNSIEVDEVVDEEGEVAEEAVPPYKADYNVSIPGYQ